MANPTHFPTTVSLPIDRPCRIVIDVKPVTGTAAFAMPGRDPMPLTTRPEQVELSVMLEEVDNE